MSAIERDEVQAALEARRELGPDYDDAIVDGLVDKIERRLADRKPPAQRRGPVVSLPLVLGSLGLSIPLLAIAGGVAGIAGVIAVCTAVVLVNFFAAARG